MVPTDHKNEAMTVTFLNVAYKDREIPKSLGARWDGNARAWYVPDGYDLAPFQQWLPAGGAAISTTGSSHQAPASESREMASLLDGDSTELAVPHKKGISLSMLLGGVSRAVAAAYETGVWTLVELVDVRVSAGHVYLGVSERDAAGAVLAKSNAAIWRNVANSILPQFEQATGVQLAPGIKLLVRARPVFKGQYGFSLEIDAIDPEYTLGDLEARKREIRNRLQQEGVYGANKALPAPWSFTRVLVIAPEGGAGLGDFRAEADRLENLGICRFEYAFSRFQGVGAAAEIKETLAAALKRWESANGAEAEDPRGGPPDVVVIIRGGGAVNDMAWLNDYELIRFVCDIHIPVFTGIGHERDSTVLDEVAHTKFDTPSKVIAGIEQVIFRRVQELKANFEQTKVLALRQLQAVKGAVKEFEVGIKAEARGHLAKAKESSTELMTEISRELDASVRLASERARDAFHLVKSGATRHLTEAKSAVPALWGQIAMGARHAASAASSEIRNARSLVLDRAQGAVGTARASSSDLMQGVAVAARSSVREASSGAEALMREITGQGPEKTLRRGFAVVRGPSGDLLTRAGQVEDGAEIEIQFQDARVPARARKPSPH